MSTTVEKKQPNISGHGKVLKQRRRSPSGKAAGKQESYANEYRQSEHFLFVEPDQAQRKECCIMMIMIFLHMIRWIKRTLTDLFFIVI